MKNGMNKTISKFLLLGAIFCSTQVFAQKSISDKLPWSIRMTESEMVRCPESWAIGLSAQIEMGLLSWFGIAGNAGCI